MDDWCRTRVFSPQIKGVVSGKFSDSVEQVYGHLALAFNLVEDFDGQVLRISSTEEKNQFERLAGAAPGQVQLVELDIHAP
ncbi:MAG: hypothetical protein ACKOF9_03500 [Burkholderiales bacterium]